MPRHLIRPEIRRGPDPDKPETRPFSGSGEEADTSLTQKQARPRHVVPAWRRGPGGTWSLTIDETATVLGISTVAVIKAIKAGELTTVQIGRQLFVPRGAVDRYRG